MEIKKKAAIIVVTYNGEKYVRPLLESLNNLDYPHDKFKIFVVDNASSDKTVEEMRKDLPVGRQGKGEGRDLDIEIIEKKENLGFAGGNNVGMRMAMELGFEFIVLLNQDMVVERDWLVELVRKAESSERIGVVQAFMLLMWDKNKIYSTGDRTNYLGIGYSENYRVARDKWDRSKSVMAYAGGAAVLFKREVLAKTGLFEELYFAYLEDADISWQARMQGFDVVLAERAICYHDYHFRHNPKTYYWTEKNRLMFLWRNFEIKTLILIFPMWLIMDLGMLFYALVTGWFWQKIRAYGWFIRHWGKILKMRKKIQAERVVKDKELKKYLVAGIEFGGLENSVLKYIANPVLKFYWVIIRRFI